MEPQDVLEEDDTEGKKEKKHKERKGKGDEPKKEKGKEKDEPKKGHKGKNDAPKKGKKEKEEKDEPKMSKRKTVGESCEDQNFTGLRGRRIRGTRIKRS